MTDNRDRLRHRLALFAIVMVIIVTATLCAHGGARRSGYAPSPSSTVTGSQTPVAVQETRSGDVEVYDPDVAGDCMLSAIEADVCREYGYDTPG